METFDTVSQLAFQQSIAKLFEEYGILGDSWQWQHARGTDIKHIAKIPGLGNLGIQTSGASVVPNATGKYFGPSWRYAVEMTEYHTAYGIYPGGQSGYPGSKFYDNMIG